MIDLRLFHINFILFVLCSIVVFSLSGQDSDWDDTRHVDWPVGFVEVSIPSSVDGAIQKAYFRPAQQRAGRPLIVSLHTWSADFRQADPLISQVLTQDYNYIRPDFRGPNNTPDAMGSPLVSSDIDDAISYAIAHGFVDPENIHVIGVSGGGHATLVAYMQSAYQIRSFSAWVPITDIPKWYEESIGRGTIYANHITLATGGGEGKVDMAEARKRSPMYMNTPIDRRAGSKLFIYAGIHDGYTGSVPITHSLEIYNKVVSDFNPNAVDALVSDDIIHRMVVSRYLAANSPAFLGGRQIHYMNRFEDKVQVVIFEGSHEMLTEVALDHVPSQTILAIGDSNGRVRGGWVDVLSDARFGDLLINACISGNTIGFDNLGRSSLNTMRNITSLLIQHDPGRTRLNKILIMLGTNDCKHEYSDRIEEVPTNYRQLLDSITAYYKGSQIPEVFMISPPPVRDDQFLEDKYQGSSERVRILNGELKKIAVERGLTYLDIQTSLWPVRDEISYDGIHLTPLGYSLLGSLINAGLSAP